MISSSSNVWKRFLRISLAVFTLTVCFDLYPPISAFNKDVLASENGTDRDDITEDAGSTRSSKRNIDQKAESLLGEMSDFLATKYRFTFKADIMFDEILDSGRKLQRSALEKVYVQKPNKLYIDYVSDVSAQELWYDVSSVTILDPPTGLYSKLVVPGSIDLTLDELLKRYDYSPPLSAFLFVNPYKILSQNLVAGYYIGSSVVFGVPCNHLAFVDKNVDWQIWIENGQRKIRRKLVVTYKSIPGSPQFIAILKDWIFDQPLSHFIFTPDIPKSARETELGKLPNGFGSDLGRIKASAGSSQTN